MGLQLPVVPEQRSSLKKDGSRNWVQPADVKGPWTSLRRWVFAVLIVIYVGLPFVNIGGHPAVFFDIPARQLYLFGFVFNAQDAWLAFLLITGVGFLLIVMAALMGRIWCGYACPQTVFLEGVFRRIERWIEGSRSVRMRRDEGPFSFDRAWRKLLKHTVFVLLAVGIAHVFLSYFTSMPQLAVMLTESPSAHLEAFTWTWAIAALLYANFAFFREQLCLVVCPYGRLQSVLMDNDSVVVGYDELRGEPRGKVSDPEAADCVDCNRCVVVCPTGIDIRNGLQLDCIGCANCIDACDEVMVKLKRPKGLIRYDSLNGLTGAARRFVRPRLFFYLALGLLGVAVATFSIGSRSSFEANAMRTRGMPFSVSDGQVLNSFQVHLVNKSDEAVRLTLETEAPTNHVVSLPAEVEMAPLGSRHVPIAIRFPRADYAPGQFVRVRISGGDPEELTEIDLELPVLGPGG